MLVRTGSLNTHCYRDLLTQPSGCEPLQLDEIWPKAILVPIDVKSIVGSWGLAELE